MKHLIIVFFSFFAFQSFCQSKVSVDASGNVTEVKVVYISEQEVITAFNLTPTSNTFTNTKGQSFKIFTTKRGSKVYIKQTKTGNWNKYSVPK